MIISLVGDQGQVEPPRSLRLDSLTIEATVPELRHIASFFSECARDVTVKMETGPVFFNGDIPGYEMTVPEILVGS